MLYRFFRVPAGVTTSEYMERYFKPGGSFIEKGYMSTSMDPEFIISHIFNRNGHSTRNSGYIVFEILTNRGIVTQNNEVTHSGNLQSLENEILLPRNSRLRVVNQKRRQKFGFASDRTEMREKYGERYRRQAFFSKGSSMNLPIIQMVDESLF